MDPIITILPVVTKDLPISPRFTPYNFLSRCKFSTLTTRQPMVEFYLLTFPRFPLRKKGHKSYFGKNRTHDFRTSRCAGYLLDHSGDEGYYNSSSSSTINGAIINTTINSNTMNTIVCHCGSSSTRLSLSFFLKLLYIYTYLVYIINRVLRICYCIP